MSNLHEMFAQDAAALAFNTDLLAIAATFTAPGEAGVAVTGTVRYDEDREATEFDHEGHGRVMRAAILVRSDDVLSVPDGSTVTIAGRVWNVVGRPNQHAGLMELRLRRFEALGISPRPHRPLRS